MWYYIRMEFKKYIWNRKFFLVLLMVLLFLGMKIYDYGATTYLGYTLEATNRGRLAEWKQKQIPPTRIDNAFIEKTKADYKRYVDQHIRSEKEIRKTLAEDDFDITYEELMRDKYEYVNSGLVVSPYLEDEAPILVDRMNYTIMVEVLSNDLLDSYDKREGEKTHLLQESQRKQLQEMAENVKQHFVGGYSIGFDYLIAMNQFLPFTLGFVLLMAFYKMFGQEKVRRIDAMILTCKQGKHKYIWGKLSTVFLLTTGLWLLFEAVILIGCTLVYGLDGASVTFYAYHSPYGLTYVQLYLIRLAVSYLGTLLMAYLICFLSQLIRSIPTLLTGFIFIILTSWVIYPTQPQGYTLLEKVNLLLPTQMMSTWNLYRDYNPYMIFQHSILYPQMVCFVLILGFLILIPGLYFMMKNRQITNG